MAYNTRLELRIWRLAYGVAGADIETAPDEMHEIWADETRGAFGASAIAVGGELDNIVTTRLEPASPIISRTFRCRKIPRGWYDAGDPETRTVMLVRLRDKSEWTVAQIAGLNRREDEITIQRGS